MTEKERVLAKCGELAPELDLNYGFWGGLIQRRFGTSTIYTDWGNVSLSEDNPEDSPVWPVAAQILGIGEEERPTNDLLWEAWKEAAHAADWSQRVRKRETERFNEWLAGLEVHRD